MEEYVLNIKSEFEKLSSEIVSGQEIESYLLRIIKADNPILLLGIDTVNMSRQLYVDLGTEVWEHDQLVALPKWRGLTLKIEFIEKLAVLRNRNFFIIKQESEQSTDIFEVVLQNLVDHYDNKDESESLFAVTYRVLDKWRNFFQRGGFQKLSDEQQRGLFGELWYMREWLSRYPTSPPLIIDNWEGPTSGRIDYKVSMCGIEIKTVADKLAKTIKISNENQLKLTKAITSILLYVCFIEPSKTHGTSLQALVTEVREGISKRSDRLLLKFNDLLNDLGFRDDDYTNSFYFVEKIEVYEARAEFPRIIKDDLPKGISQVSYNIDLTHCEAFSTEEDNAYQM
jgi:hypothetical protein